MENTDSPQDLNRESHRTANPSAGPPAGRSEPEAPGVPLSGGFTPPRGAIHHRVRVVGSDGGSVEGDVYVQAWDHRERMMRSLKFGAGCFGLAVVSIPIVFLHFFLVPAFLIATPIVSYKAFQTQAVALGGMSKCPKCSAPLAIVRQKLEWPLKDVCAKCFENVKIEDLGISNSVR